MSSARSLLLICSDAALEPLAVLVACDCETKASEGRETIGRTAASNNQPSSNCKLLSNDLLPTPNRFAANNHRETAELGTAAAKQTCQPTLPVPPLLPASLLLGSTGSASYDCQHWDGKPARRRRARAPPLIASHHCSPPAMKQSAEGNEEGSV